MLTAVTLVGTATPVFVIGLLLMIVVCGQLQWLPFPQYVDFADDPTQWAWNLLLPWLSLALIEAAKYARLTRSSMLETLADDHVRTFRAYGRRAVFVCGKGNNGADGIVAARLLRHLGIGTDVFTLGDDFDRDAARRAFGRADLFVDAMFGTGFRGELEGHAAFVARTAAHSRIATLALSRSPEPTIEDLNAPRRWVLPTATT